MSNNWGKRVKVPLEHKEFGACFRAGHNDGSKAYQKLPATYFSAENRERAYAAYLAGFDLGKQERTNDAA